MRSWQCSILLLGLWGCPRAAPPAAPVAPIDLAAERAAVLAAERDWADAVEDHDVERVLAFFAPDGASLPPDEPMVVGDPARRDYLTRLFGEPAFESGWETTRVEIARAGDMALSEGTTWHRGLDPAGQPIVEAGKYVTVWVKVDGRWLVASDIWNSTSVAPASGSPSSDAEGSAGSP